MSREKKIMIIILSLFSVLMVITAIILYINSINSSREPLEMGTIEADTGFIKENLAIYQDTMALEDWSLDNYPYRVRIINPADLASCGLDNFAIDALEPFLDLYLNMYDPSALKYQGEVQTDSFIRNESIPQFMVCIHQETGNELMIQCTYYVQAQLYEFSSSLSK